MSYRSTDNSEHFDCSTSTSICAAIGEWLRQDLRPESSGLPQRLQRLLDEMQRQDCGTKPRHDRA